MKNIYLMEWMDQLINSYLNPSDPKIYTLSKPEADAIIAKINDEKKQIQLNLLDLVKKKHIRVQVRYYHSNIVLLLEQAFVNKKGLKPGSEVERVYNHLMEALDKLISNLEFSFSAYLSMDKFVPITLLLRTKEKLRLQLDGFKDQFVARINDERLTTLVLEVLYKFLGTDEEYRVSYNSLLYYTNLIDELKDLDEPEADFCIFTALNELLVKYNFNHNRYINHFTKRISARVNAFETNEERIENMMLLFKDFTEMHVNPGDALYPTHPSLAQAISNWFEKEIMFLEKKLHLSATPVPSINANYPSARPEKLICALTADQISLILHAAFAIGLLIAKSLSALFRIVIPRLSTREKADLNWNTVRSKSYEGEQRDRDISADWLINLADAVRTGKY